MTYEVLSFFVFQAYFCFQAEDCIRVSPESRGLGDVYRGQSRGSAAWRPWYPHAECALAAATGATAVSAAVAGVQYSSSRTCTQTVQSSSDALSVCVNDVGVQHGQQYQCHYCSSCHSSFCLLTPKPLKPWTLNPKPLAGIQKKTFRHTKKKTLRRTSMDTSGPEATQHKSSPQCKHTRQPTLTTIPNPTWLRKT